MDIACLLAVASAMRALQTSAVSRPSPDDHPPARRRALCVDVHTLKLTVLCALPHGAVCLAEQQ